MSKTVRLTAAQAIVRYLATQWTTVNGVEVPLFGGVWAIFGHGNVAGLGPALYQHRSEIQTYRSHNEQAMAHSAIAFAKTNFRQRMMACTTSIGPGATNMVTAAALAHVNRLPVLFLPGDVFASRSPDPVLQQIEHTIDGTASANDCFRPVSRYWDRLTRPEQVLAALPRALQVLTDPADCGPVTICLPQDVQTMAFDYPESFFAKRIRNIRRSQPDKTEVASVAKILRNAQKPIIISGGGVIYSLATEDLIRFSEKFGIPVCETQAGKGAVPWDHPNYVGAIGVTGSTAANNLVNEADVVLAIGTRLQDFTTASSTLLSRESIRVIGLNVSAIDAAKYDAMTLVADASAGLVALLDELNNAAAIEDLHEARSTWINSARSEMRQWNDVVDKATSLNIGELPTDGEVVGAVNRATEDDDVVVAAAGTIPAELHKLWRSKRVGSYHLEYGFSCMGYEIAAGIGVRLAKPKSEVCVLVGDGSYLMMNSEIATSVMMGTKVIVVVLDNRGFGCINRLQQSCGSSPFNNLLSDSIPTGGELPEIDFVAHAASLGAIAEKATGIESLQRAVRKARLAERTTVIVIDTSPEVTTDDGGAWWEVAISEVSEDPNIVEARKSYEQDRRSQRW